MRKIVVFSSFATLLVVLFVGCGEDELFFSNETTTQSTEALRVSDRLPVVDDSLFCPFPLEAEDGTTVVSDDTGLVREVDGAADDVVAYRPRIEVDLQVDEADDYLVLKVSFYNPYRCHWVGHLFLEREDEAGNVETIGRRYDYLIRGGTRVGGRIIVRRPPPGETALFVARAYRPDGMDQKTYVNCLLSSADTDPAQCAEVLAEADDVVRSDDVVEEVWDEEPATDAELADLDDCVDADRPPMDVGLRLRGHGRYVELLSTWQNVTRRVWGGDLYIDYTGPFNGVRIQRRDLDRRILPGVGFCMWDRTRLYGFGVYRFAARALHRDGGAQARWHSPGTTEIDGVCNGEICELIEPDQQRASIVLTGRSSIHLVSHFFSEFTRVTMAYPGISADVDEMKVFDITEYCEIRQRFVGGLNYIEVSFNTFNLPIGPRTWAYYTVELNPMPAIPEGAKLTDSLWILTNGGELTDLFAGD